MVSFTTRPLYPQGMNHQYSFIRRLKSRSGRFGEGVECVCVCNVYVCVCDVCVWCGVVCVWCVSVCVCMWCDVCLCVCVYVVCDEYGVCVWCVYVVCDVYVCV